MKKSTEKSGYTLIEMIIVITMLAITLPAVFSIVYVILSQQVRLYRITETKRQGDAIMSNMKENILRRATAIRSPLGFAWIARCNDSSSTHSSNTGENFWFAPEIPGGNMFRYIVPASSSTISYQEGSSQNFASINPNVAINNSQVQVTGFQIACNRATVYAAPLVQFSYDVTYNDPSPGDEDPVRLHYQTKIRLRQ